MFFDLASCPTGWSEFVAARGRAVVGVPADGALGGTVGDSFSDQENRDHAHTVDPLLFNTQVVGSHKHDYDFGPIGLPRTGSDGFHNHEWSRWDHPSWIGFTQGASLTTAITYGNGIGAEGSGNFLFGVQAGDPNQSFWTDLGPDHSHAIPTTHWDQMLSDGDHLHGIDVPETASSDAQTGDVMPYVQLLACEKD